MRQYLISYYLDDFYHVYTQMAASEDEAKRIALRMIPETSMSIMHDMQIRRVEDYWP